MDRERNEQGHEISQVLITFDHETSIVGIGCTGVPIGLLQMMLHEATIQADQLRRRAAISQIQQEQADAAIRASLGNGTHRRA